MPVPWAALWGNQFAFSFQELVKLLHKALEAAQQEKRVSSMYLTAAEDKDRLELVRHKVRQIADLTSRLEALEQEKKELEQILTLRDSHIQELKEHVQLLMEKNHAKQQVIMALTEQTAREHSDPLQEANTITAETLYKQQEEIEHLKVCRDDTVYLGAPIPVPSGSLGGCS